MAATTALTQQIILYRHRQPRNLPFHNNKKLTYPSFLTFPTKETFPNAIISCKRSQLSTSVAALATGHDHDVAATLEKCFTYDHDDDDIKGCYGSVAVQRSKPEVDRKTKTFDPEVAIELDNTGGGRPPNNIGGGGSGGGGDDDDYFEDYDDEEDDDFLFRKRFFLKELFAKRFIDAVLSEWQKTVLDLPEGLRQACEMGLVSSAQLVRFLMNEARPNIVRSLARALPPKLSRAFIGRMIADPAFLHKLLLEQFVTIAFSVRSELKTRGDRIREEWDLALINVITAATCNFAVAWSLAPCRSYGTTFRSDLQNTLQKLPNNIFEASYPLREFDLQKRIKSLVCKAIEFSLVGFTAGAAQSALSNISTRKKQTRLSVQIPSISRNALGYGAFLGLYTNWRYQMVYGIDKVLANQFDVIGVALFFTTAFRILNAHLEEISRVAWLDRERPVSQKAEGSRKEIQRKRRVVRKKVPARTILV